MKARTNAFNAWVGGASEAEVKEMISAVRKRKYIFLGIWLLIAAVLAAAYFLFKAELSSIAALGVFALGIPSGCACFCNNNLRTLKSRGRKVGGSLIGVWFYLIIGLILMPILVVQLGAKSDKIGGKILGFKG